jgi:hypothetical protein
VHVRTTYKYKQLKLIGYKEKTCDNRDRTIELWFRTLTIDRMCVRKLEWYQARVLYKYNTLSGLVSQSALSPGFKAWFATGSLVYRRLTQLYFTQVHV